MNRENCIVQCIVRLNMFKVYILQITQQIFDLSCEWDKHKRINLLNCWFVGIVVDLIKEVTKRERKNIIVISVCFLHVTTRKVSLWDRSLIQIISCISMCLVKYCWGFFLSCILLLRESFLLIYGRSNPTCDVLINH